MAHLNEAALATLTGYGVSPEQWFTHHGHNGEWFGDACGCPDDRCVGHHHAVDEYCGCLRALLNELNGASQC